MRKGIKTYYQGRLFGWISLVGQGVPRRLPYRGVQSQVNYAMSGEDGFLC